VRRRDQGGSSVAVAVSVPRAPSTLDTAKKSSLPFAGTVSETLWPGPAPLAGAGVARHVVPQDCSP
jgi:hypothetical protein